MSPAEPGASCPAQQAGLCSWPWSALCLLSSLVGCAHRSLRAGRPSWAQLAMPSSAGGAPHRRTGAQEGLLLAAGHIQSFSFFFCRAGEGSQGLCVSGKCSARGCAWHTLLTCQTSPAVWCERCWLCAGPAAGAAGAGGLGQPRDSTEPRCLSAALRRPGQHQGRVAGRGLPLGQLLSGGQGLPCAPLQCNSPHFCPPAVGWGNVRLHGGRALFSIVATSCPWGPTQGSPLGLCLGSGLLPPAPTPGRLRPLGLVPTLPGH